MTEQLLDGPRPGPDPIRHRRHAVRRGRRRIRQDPCTRRPGDHAGAARRRTAAHDRRRHLHREGRRRAARSAAGRVRKGSERPGRAPRRCSAGRPRLGRDRHSARLRPADPARPSDRSRPAAAHRRPGRGRFVGRLRGALGRAAAAAAGRRLDRGAAAARDGGRGRAETPAIAGTTVRERLGPDRRTRAGGSTRAGVDAGSVRARRGGGADRWSGRVVSGSRGPAVAEGGADPRAGGDAGGRDRPGDAAGDPADVARSEGRPDRTQGELAGHQPGPRRLHRGGRGRRFAGRAAPGCLPSAPFTLDRRARAGIGPDPP